MTNTETDQLPAAPPYATARVNGVPYVVERHVLRGVPCLIERPLTELRGVALVYHGVTAAKEGNAGVFTELVAHGVAVVLPDSAGHGERQTATLSPEVLGYRNYLRTCAALTALEAHKLIEAVRDLLGLVPLGVIGISMGGYTAQYLLLRESRASAVCVISSGGEWREPEVTLPLAAEFLNAHRPVSHAHLAPPTPLLLLHGDTDPVFPLGGFQATEAAYRAAYEAAGAPHRVESRVYPGVEHWTSPGMRDDAVAFLRAHLLGETDVEGAVGGV